MKKENGNSGRRDRLIAITLREPRSSSEDKIGSPLGLNEEVSLVDTCQRCRSTERLPSDERVCVTQHGRKKGSWTRRGRERGSHPRLTHGGRSMEFQRVSVERRRSATKLAKGEQGPEASTLFLPLTRRGNPLSAHPFLTRPMQRGLTSDRGNRFSVIVIFRPASGPCCFFSAASSSLLLSIIFHDQVSS